MADALERLDETFGLMLMGLEPQARRRAGLRLGRELRKLNLARISANVDPDGAPFAARKPRDDPDARTGRMFRGLRLMRNWKVDATANDVTLRPANAFIEGTAAVHHFGQVGYVGRLRDGRVIRTRYEERRLIGIPEPDTEVAARIAMGMLEPQ